MKEKLEEISQNVDQLKKHLEKIKANIESRIYHERRMAGYEDLDQPRGGKE